MRALIDSLREVIDAHLAESGSKRGVVVRADYLVEQSGKADHGDLTTNAALINAGPLGVVPQQLAQELRGLIEKMEGVASVEIAGPGFLNITVTFQVLGDALSDVCAKGPESFGRGNAGVGKRVQVEFVSANPTGPLHVGNGWWAVYGDSVARLLAWTGSEVTREYYVNDTGGQIRTLGGSLLALKVGEGIPEQGYQGEYLVDLSSQYTGSDDIEVAGRWAAARILDEIKESLTRLGVHFDEWFSQASIEETGAVASVIELLSQSGAIFEQDGALWFRATDFGDTRDRVLRKSNGDYTYLAGDIAYHYNKFAVRSFDRVIDVLGADHHGQVASLHAACRALELKGELEVRLGQMVSLLKGGKSLKFSKRQGTAVPLTWLLDELGTDASRLLILSTSIDRQVQVDLEAALTQSMENPLYYIMYAHARIASVLRTAQERGYRIPRVQEVRYERLVHARERALALLVLGLPEVIERAARERAPHKMVSWLQATAGAFHGMYYDCPIIVQDDELRDARLALIMACQVALQTAFTLIGVTPRDHM